MPRATQVHEQVLLPADQRLPPKDLANFRSLFKLYEHKQYKKALKAADAILKVNPKHGETLAIKGLTLSCIPGRKAEALESCRLGVRHYPLSYVTWHLYGLLFRGEHDFLPAIKCFKNSLRIEPENATILRDLSWMQIQVRDFRGFVDSVNKLIVMQPTAPVNWLSLSVGHHLSGDFEQASATLQTFVESQKVSEKPEPKVSEVAMYRALVLEEGGDLEAALELLADQEDRIMDKLELHEKRAELLLRLKRWDASIEAFRLLMDKYSSETYSYHKGLLAALTQDLSVWTIPATCASYKEAPSAFLSRVNLDTHSAAVVDYYQDLRKAFARSEVVKGIQLRVLDASSPEFKAELDIFSRAKLLKGVPSLFADLKTLFSEPAKQAAITELFEAYSAALEKTGRLSESDEENTPLAPVIAVWVWYVLARIRDHVGDTDGALSLVDKCLDHTPTIVEIQQFRGSVFKHAGDIQMAAVEAEKARLMDLQDRYQNVFSTKYLLAADRHDKAVEVVGAFTKIGVDPQKNLDEMQALWFFLAAAAGHSRTGQKGRALKALNSIETHFEDIVNEQFEFHYYCVARKMTLRAYVAVLRFEDALAGSDSFRKAFSMIAELYLELHDNPELLDFKTPEEVEAAAEEERVADMDDAEKKRYARQKRRDDAEREKREEEERRAKEIAKATAAKNIMHRPAGREEVEDKDPYGLDFLRLKDSTPLDEALKRARRLVEHSPKWPRSHELNAEVFIRRNKPLVVLRSIQKLRSLVSADDAVVPTLSARLFHLTRSPEGKVDQAAVQSILDEAEKDLLGESGKSTESFLTEWLSATPARDQDLATRRRVAEALVATGSRDAGKALLTGTGEEKYLQRGHHDLPEVVAAHKFLVGSFGADDKDVAALASASAARFPYSLYFHPERADAAKQAEQASSADANVDGASD